jgi:hypothetical protein
LPFTAGSFTFGLYFLPEATAEFPETLMLRCYFLAIVGLVFSASVLTAQTPNSTPAPAATESAPPQETMEDPQVGDHWTYEFRDDITGNVKSILTNTVTDVSGSQINVQITRVGNANSGYLTFDHSWNLINNGVWRFTPNDGSGIQAPLAVGKTWPFKSTDLNSTAGVIWKRSGTSKVTAQESVTTPAGTFDTFKIETSFQIQNTNDSTRKIQAVQQTWYAPAIDHWVKRSFISRSESRVREKNTVELVEYGRR